MVACHLAPPSGERSAPSAGPGEGPPASPLQALQTRFFALVTAREDVPGALARLGLDEAAAEALTPGDDRLDAVGRIGIYNDMYFVRLLDVLREDFPTVAAVVGDDAFRALVADYLEVHPPRDHSLRHFGASLPGFIATNAVTSERPLAWLPALAAFEWARADVFDAPDAEPLTLADLQRLPPQQLPTLELRAIAGLRLLEACHAVEETWRSVDEGHDVVPPAPTPRHLLVWRAGLAVVHRAADADEAPLLARLPAGLTFGALCDQLGETHEVEAAAQRAFALTARWLAEGVLSRAEPRP